MEYLSAELLAKNIAKAVNRFREEQGDKPIESTKELLEALVVYGCSYRNRVCTILTENKIFSKRQNGIKVEYTFSDPKEPIHWSLFRNVRDTSYCQKDTSQSHSCNTKKQNKLKNPGIEQTVPVNKVDIKELWGMIKVLSKTCEEFGNLKFASLLARCTDAKDRDLLYSLYRIKEYAQAVCNRGIGVANFNSLFEIIEGYESNQG